MFYTGLGFTAVGFLLGALTILDYIPLERAVPPMVIMMVVGLILAGVAVVRSVPKNSDE